MQDQIYRKDWNLL